MPRTARKYQLDKSLVFHIVNRGILRQTIFHEDSDMEFFLHTLKRYKGKFDFNIYHWCIMPNHYHLVMELKKPETLTKIIGACQQIYTLSYHKKYKTAGRLFQNRFKSQAIEKGTYLLVCGRYVELNPIRINLVKLPWEWKFSSAFFYIYSIQDGITSIDPEWQGNSNPLSYKEWLLDIEAAKKEQKIFTCSQSIIGSQLFKTRLIIEKGRPTLRGKGRPVGILNL